MKLWSDEDYKRKKLKAIFRGNNVRPNRSEKKLNEVLQRLFPNEWKYVGDGDFVLAGKIPDFVNVNGQKKIIELFGDYYHSEKVTNIPVKQHVQERINLFAQYGYQTLIIWENELRNSRLLDWKLRKFNSIDERG